MIANKLKYFDEVYKLKKIENYKANINQTFIVHKIQQYFMAFLHIRTLWTITAYYSLYQADIFR